MITRFRSSRNTLIFGAVAAWGLTLVSCVVANRAIIIPPHIPGAQFVGSKDCADCHRDLTGAFHGATHAKLMAPGENARNIGCESCHGPGSVHSKQGGIAGTIVNPARNPEA